MKSTFNICFYAKKDKQKAGGAYPLFARITVDGVASRFNTKLDVLPEMWDGKAGKAIGRTAEAGRINRMLSDINASLNTIYHEMQRRDNYVTAEKVKNEFLGHSENHETILTLFQKHNEDVKQLVGISKTIATYRKYEVTRRHLAEFIQSKYNLSGVVFAYSLQVRLQHHRQVHAVFQAHHHHSPKQWHTGQRPVRQL